jgi:hypothetical protein
MNLHGTSKTLRQLIAPVRVLELLGKRTGNDDIDVSQVISSYVEQLLVDWITEMLFEEGTVSVSGVMIGQFERQPHQPFSGYVDIEKGGTHSLGQSSPVKGFASSRAAADYIGSCHDFALPPPHQPDQGCSIWHWLHPCMFLLG